MKKVIIYIIPLLLLAACNGNDKKETEKKSDLTELVIPDEYQLLKKADGDLDNDGIDERVFVYDTDSSAGYGTERIVFICKKEENKWMQWKKVQGPVLPSLAGGVQGEPFEDILIDKGKLYISHTGGASMHWYYNHCYELSGKDFKLSKVVVDYGRPCVKWETYIYDLKSGKLSYELAPDECSDELIEEYVIAAHHDYEIKKSDLPKMNGFIPGENELKVPGTKDVVYY